MGNERSIIARVALTPEHQCSYLPEKKATFLFFNANNTFSLADYQTLSEKGFRRSGEFLYHPHCNDCKACISLRIPVNNFSISRRLRRIKKRNVDLKIKETTEPDLNKYYPLYQKYISARHVDGAMYPPNEAQMRSFFTSSWSNVGYVEYWKNGIGTAPDSLIMVSVIEEIPDGILAVYTFFDPDFESRSPGVLSILNQIELARTRGKSHLYLGYWIKNSAKMAYKSSFRPHQILQNGEWVTPV